MPVQATVENVDEQDKGQELLKYRVSRSSDSLNQYIVSVSVPRDILHQFESKLILTYPATSKSVTIPISFTGKDGYYYEESSYSSGYEDEGEGFINKFTNLFSSSSKGQEGRKSGERTDDQTHRRSGPSPVAYLIVVLLCFTIVLFVSNTCCSIPPEEFWYSFVNGRCPRRKEQRRPNVAPVGNRPLAREPIRPIFPRPKDSFNVS